jgi:hypothetical protein
MPVGIEHSFERKIRLGPLNMDRYLQRDRGRPCPVGGNNRGGPST